LEAEPQEPDNSALSAGSHCRYGGHFSLDMAANATAAQMSNFSNTWLKMAS